MQPPRKRQMLERLSRDTDFLSWLAEQEAKDITALTEQLDMALIHRTQGRVSFVRGLLRDMEQIRTAP